MEVLLPYNYVTSTEYIFYVEMTHDAALAASLHAHGCQPGWVQGAVLRAADYPSWCLAETPKYTTQKLCSGA